MEKIKICRKTDAFPGWYTLDKNTGCYYSPTVSFSVSFAVQQGWMEVVEEHDYKEYMKNLSKKVEKNK